MEGFHVFVSHSSNDAHEAAELVELLESRGVRCWYAPRDIEPGTDFAESIYNAIAGSAGMVVLLSHSANGSAHVAREVAIAGQMKRRVAPIKIDNSQPSGALCYYVRNLQIGNLKEMNPEFASRLVGSLRLQLGLNLPSPEA